MDDHAEEHILSYAKLAGVLCALLALTAVTIASSRVDLGVLNIWVALLIASIKGGFVILYFMHLKYEPGVLKLAFLGTAACLAMVIGFIFWDISFR